MFPSKTTDGVTLHGWFIAGRSSRVLLFFHGNAGNISHRLDSIRQFLALGLSVLIIDYRGYGQSEGRTTEKGTYRDADAAWRYLIEGRGIAASDIVIFGRSLGASVASRLAAQTSTVGPYRGILLHVSSGHCPGSLSMAPGALAEPP